MNLFKVINQLCNVQYHTNSNLWTSFFIMCVYNFGEYYIGRMNMIFSNGIHYKACLGSTL